LHHICQWLQSLARTRYFTRQVAVFPAATAPVTHQDQELRNPPL
jgi:hypothetical protein